MQQSTDSLKELLVKSQRRASCPSLPSRVRLDLSTWLATPPEHEGLEPPWDYILLMVLIYMAYDIFCINEASLYPPQHMPILVP